MSATVRPLLKLACVCTRGIIKCRSRRVLTLAPGRWAAAPRAALLARPGRRIEPGKGGESASLGAGPVQRAGGAAGSSGARLRRAGRTWDTGGQPQLRQSRVEGAHPGGAAPGGDLGAGVAQPQLLGHRLMTALQPPAPARRSCRAGGSGRVEGLWGRAEGAEFGPRTQ